MTMRMFAHVVARWLPLLHRMIVGSCLNNVLAPLNVGLIRAVIKADLPKIG